MILRKGTEISLKHDPMWGAINIWKVCYRIRINGKLETREKFVAGINSCGGRDGEREATLSVAAVYGGQKIQILSAEFVGTGVMAGEVWERQKQYWKSLKTLRELQS
jgi:hypothetical protein